MGVLFKLIVSQWQSTLFLISLGGVTIADHEKEKIQSYLVGAEIGNVILCAFMDAENSISTLLSEVP